MSNAYYRANYSKFDTDGEREAKLLEEARRALKLKHQGLTFVQISQRMGCSQEKARQLVLKAEGRA